jgi:hypothetical protein
MDFDAWGLVSNIVRILFWIRQFCVTCTLHEGEIRLSNYFGERTSNRKSLYKMKTLLWSSTFL